VVATEAAGRQQAGPGGCQELAAGDRYGVERAQGRELSRNFRKLEDKLGFVGRTLG
jgi:hypothetical protein